MKNIVLFACNLIVLMTMLSSCGGTQMKQIQNTVFRLILQK